MNQHLGVSHRESLQHGFGLITNRLAVVRLHSRFQNNVDAAPVAGFDPDVGVGADVLAPVSRLAYAFGLCFCIGHIFFVIPTGLSPREICVFGLRELLRSYAVAPPARARLSLAKIASVIWLVLTAPWLRDFAPPEIRIMS